MESPEEILKLMLDRSEYKQAIGKYFHFKCKLWRAIQHHITYSDDCVLIKRASDVCIYPGTGGAISLIGFDYYKVWSDAEESSIVPDFFFIHGRRENPYNASCLPASGKPFRVAG